MNQRLMLYLIIYLGSVALFDYWLRAFFFIRSSVRQAYRLADTVGQHDYEYLTDDKKVIQPDGLAEGS